MAIPSVPTGRTRLHAALRATITSFSARTLPLIAAGVAFYGILALFPALASVVAIWGLVADPGVVQQQLELARGFLPPDAFALIDDQVGQLIAADRTALGWTFALSVGVALWSARLGVAGLMQGLNAAYRVAGRSTIRHYAVAMSITLMLIGVAIAALALVVVVPLLLAFLPLGPLQQTALSATRWLVAVALLVVALGVLYRFGPNRPRPTAAFLSPGVAIALGIWVAVSWGLSFYLSNFGDYNQVYGTLGAVIALLLWLWLSAVAVLAGALVNAEWEAQRPAEPDRHDAATDQ